MRIRLIIGAAALLLWPFATWSGGLDETTGDRENYVLIPDGRVLIVSQPTDDAAGLVRRDPDGTESTIVTDSQSLGGGTLDGIGSSPHMNANGVAAFQVCLDVGTECADNGDQEGGTNGIYTGTPGSVTEIAISGDTIAGETICIIEPYPLINSADQVFWGTTVEGGAGVTTTCDEDGDHLTNGRKAIYRFTPPSTHALLLLADVQGAGDGADTVTAVVPFGAETFDIIDAHLIAHGGDAVTSSGNALVTAWLELQNGEKGNAQKGAQIVKERKSLLYVTPTTISLVAMDDFEGNAPGTPSPIGWLGHGVANASGLVFFKGEQEDSGNSPATMNLWTSGGGLSELVATGDGLPSGPGAFNGFPPLQDLNNSGAAAFTAGLDINGACNASTDPSVVNCKGVYYSPDGSSIVEVARTTIAVTAGGVGVNFADGFEFEGISSVAVMAEDGTVFFMAENLNPDPLCGDLGEDEISGVMAWSPGGGAPLKVIAEGDLLPQGKVMRLFLPMPELRQHDGADGNFVVRVWFDTTGNCLPDLEEIFLATMPPMAPVGVIPTLGPWGLWLLIGFLAMLGGGRLLQRRNS